MMIFETQMQLVNYLIRKIDAQAYGLREALEERFKKEVECIGSADIKEVMMYRFPSFNLQVSPFYWLNNNGEKIEIRLRVTHVITHFSDDEDDLIIETFYAYDNPKE